MSEAKNIKNEINGMSVKSESVTSSERAVHSRVGQVSTNANEKVDNFDEKHDGESKPETQHAADV